MPQIIDMHCDTVVEIQAGIDLNTGNPGGHVDLKRLRNGGVFAQVFACFVSSEIPQNNAFRRANEMIDLLDQLCKAQPDQFHLMKDYTDMIQPVTENGINVLIAVENGYTIENDLKNLASLKQKNVCYMTLTHSKNLPWAASSGESGGPFKGLTAFGRKVVGAMNEMGMVIDVSHVHESTFWDVIRVSKKPIIASHSNARAICDTPRNLSDDQIRALADNGGMIGINFFPGFLDQIYATGLKANCGDLFAELDKIETVHTADPSGKRQALLEFSRELQRRMRKYRVPAVRIIDHICHITDLVGVDHVGFGSDFDGIPAIPDGVQGSDIYPILTTELALRGFSEKEILKIASGNFMRVLEHNLVL